MSIAHATAQIPGPVTVTPAATLPSATPAANSDEGFSFDDLVDIVNPLQHLPVVSTIYRHMTGDTIKPFPKAAGDMLYGGVTGFLGSIADTVFTKVTGKSFGDTVLAKVESLFGDDAASDVASNAAPSTVTVTPAANAAQAPLTAVASNDAPSTITSNDAPSTVASNDAPSAITVTPAADAQPAPLAVAAVATAPAFILSDSPIDTTATPVASTAPQLSAPADVKPATLDSIVVPGQDALLQALSRNGVSPDMALRAADAYRRTINVASTAANNAAPAPTLRTSITQ